MSLVWRYTAFYTFVCFMFGFFPVRFVYAHIYMLCLCVFDGDDVAISLHLSLFCYPSLASKRQFEILIDLLSGVRYISIFNKCSAPSFHMAYIRQQMYSNSAAKQLYNPK